MPNLQRPNASDVSQTTNRSRNVVPGSGICSRCIDGCTGNCEVFKSTFRGRELLYPGPFGAVTAGGDKDYPVDFSHFNVMGYALGARGLPAGVEATPDNSLFTRVDTEVEIGHRHTEQLRMPIISGALGSTEIARANWEHFAAGAAISGVVLTCGENVAGIDPDLKLDKHGKIIDAPDLRRRVETYRRWHDGYGDIHVQMNVEDTAFGVAEYAIGQLGVETIELKWGQGAKCIGGEIKVDSLERALELQQRGYLVTPDPSNVAVQAAYRDGAIKQFERHSRLGFVDQESFASEVERLRGLGAKRVTLKTGAYPMRELAMALRWSSDLGIDLVTIDGASGGTGMSPWRMMVEWGVPPVYLLAMTYELCQELERQGAYIPSIAFGGGLSAEDQIFKVLAIGAPYVKAVCMGRAIMIPGMVGKNIAKWLEADQLPRTVSEFGVSVEEIFVTYETLKARFGSEISELPLGAIGWYTYVDKLQVGLQQLMAGSRNYRLDAISRQDVAALTHEAADITGISFIMDAYRDQAMDIIAGNGHHVPAYAQQTGVAS
jgi:glutamate synthase domain-containing protein 2